MPKKGTKPQHIDKLASVEGVEIDRAPAAKQAALEARIAELEKEIETERGLRSQSEQDALRLAESQGMLMQREIVEVPTGRYATVYRQESLFVKSHRPDDGRPVLAAKLKKVKVPTFFYKIDLPPVGGLDIKVNGKSYPHGMVFEYDEDLLRSVKDIVARCWAHENSLHTNNENVYRKPQRPTLRMR